MAISTECAHCGRSYTVLDEAAGRKFRCKACGHAIDVPGASLGGGPVSPKREESSAAWEAFDSDHDADDHLDDSLAQRRRDRRNREGSESTGLSRGSLILGCVVWGLAVIGFVVLMGIGLVINQAVEEGAPPEDQFAALGMMGMGICGVGCLTYVLSLVGGILGLVALNQQTTGHGQAIAGLVLNGLYFIGTTGLFLLAMLIRQV